MLAPALAGAQSAATTSYSGHSRQGNPCSAPRPVGRAQSHCRLQGRIAERPQARLTALGEVMAHSLLYKALKVHHFQH